MSIVWYFAALVVLIALSAFFSASEMSYSSANRLRLENAAEDGDRNVLVKCAVAGRAGGDPLVPEPLFGRNAEIARTCACGQNEGFGFDGVAGGEADGLAASVGQGELLDLVVFDPGPETFGLLLHAHDEIEPGHAVRNGQRRAAQDGLVVVFGVVEGVIEEGAVRLGVGVADQVAGFVADRVEKLVIAARAVEEHERVVVPAAVAGVDGFGEPGEVAERSERIRFSDMDRRIGVQLRAVCDETDSARGECGIQPFDQTVDPSGGEPGTFDADAVERKKFAAVGEIVAAVELKIDELLGRQRAAS